RQLLVEARAQRQEAGNPAADLDGAFGRPHDSRQDLEQRALARAVGPDDAQRLAMGDAQRDVPERPEPDRRPAQYDVRDGLPDRPLSAEPQVVFDAQVLGEDRGMRLRSLGRARDDGRRHPSSTFAKSGSSRLKKIAASTTSTMLATRSSSRLARVGATGWPPSGAP